MNYTSPDIYFNQNQQNPFENKQNFQNDSTESILDVNEINKLRKSLKSTPTFIKCPFCKIEEYTRVDKSCNIADSLFCLLTLGTLWMFIHICRGKDINCSDADHYCTGCNNKIGKYTSC